jgi:multicomponent Na+:H+ antiporter subunit G
MGGALLQALGIALLFLGLVLSTIGLYGMLRRPDIFHQLHAAGLITGPAVILVLLASLGTGVTTIITSAALVIVFVLVTAPLAAHAIAQAALRREGPPHEDPAGRRRPAASRRSAEDRPD